MIDITGMHVCRFITLRVRHTTERSVPESY